MTPTEAGLDAATPADIEYEIWRSYRANDSWVRAGRFRTRAEAIRATPNWGRAPGWVVLPVRARRVAAPA